MCGTNEKNHTVRVKGYLTDVELFQFFEICQRQKQIEKIEIVTLSNHPSGIKYLQMCQRHSDVLYEVEIILFNPK